MNAALVRLAAVVICLVVSGCDQDPFGLSYREIGEGYYLHRWEDGRTYYLEDEDHGPPGGVIDGVVEAIGWNGRFILVKRRSIFGGDPHGWMLVDTKDKTVRGPVPDPADLPKAGGIAVVGPEQAWTLLGAGHRSSESGTR